MLVNLHNLKQVNLYSSSDPVRKIAADSSPWIKKWRDLRLVIDNSQDRDSELGDEVKIETMGNAQATTSKNVDDSPQVRLWKKRDFMGKFRLD